VEQAMKQKTVDAFVLIVTFLFIALVLWAAFSGRL
jgi:hypothetical protein